MGLPQGGAGRHKQACIRRRDNRQAGCAPLRVGCWVYPRPIASGGCHCPPAHTCHGRLLPGGLVDLPGRRLAKQERFFCLLWPLLLARCLPGGEGGRPPVGRGGVGGVAAHSVQPHAHARHCGPALTRVAIAVHEFAVQLQCNCSDHHHACSQPPSGALAHRRACCPSNRRNRRPATRPPAHLALPLVEGSSSLALRNAMLACCHRLAAFDLLPAMAKGGELGGGVSTGGPLLASCATQYYKAVTKETNEMNCKRPSWKRACSLIFDCPMPVRSNLLARA